ncbi:MAG TPA: sigma-E factor negative regulatory protein [Gammaproteobacteria bacterium]
MADDRQQQLSAFLDGELAGPAAERLLGELTGDPALRAAWTRYHLIGTALRRGVPERFDPDLPVRVAAAIGDSLPDEVAPAAAGGDAQPWLKPAAGLALAASVAALAIFGVRLVQVPESSAPALAGVAAQVTPALPAQPVSERLDQERIARYLLRHSEITSSRPMQGMLPYVRVVSQDSQAQSAR